MDDYSIKYKTIPQKIREKILLEQNSQCAECGIDSWNGKKLILELHHKDGDNQNNSRFNVVFLCPNCHSITDGYKFYGKKHSEETKNKLRKKIIDNQ